MSAVASLLLTPRFSEVPGGVRIAAQIHIDRNLTLKRAEAGASPGPPTDALLTSKCVKFIGSAVEWGNRATSSRRSRRRGFSIAREGRPSARGFVFLPCREHLPPRHRSWQRRDHAPLA